MGHGDSIYDYRDDSNPGDTFEAMKQRKAADDSRRVVTREMNSDGIETTWYVDGHSETWRPAE